jgi:predicted P-loop ATPase
VASQNRYDSAQLWLGRLKWDGTPRVRGFLETYLGCAPSEYVRAVSTYIWTALAGRVLEPGVKADMVPIFEGRQGLRKSWAIEAMAPAPEFFVEIDLADKEDDTVRKLRGALVGEIAELSGLHTRDLEGIKKFVVRKVEKWVPKYKEFPSTFKRRLLFIGTTNQTEILADDTGNRRWLPLHIEHADAEGIARDREQLWAEGAELFRGVLPGVHGGGVAWRDAERLAAPMHEGYAMSDAWDTRVHEWLTSFDDSGLECDGARGLRPFTTADVLAGALGLSARDMNRNAANRVGAILRAMDYEQKSAKRGGRTFRAWIVKGNGVTL